MNKYKLFPYRIPRLLPPVSGLTNVRACVHGRVPRRNSHEDSNNPTIGIWASLEITKVARSASKAYWRKECEEGALHNFRGGG